MRPRSSPPSSLSSRNKLHAAMQLYSARSLHVYHLRNLEHSLAKGRATVLMLDLLSQYEHPRPDARIAALEATLRQEFLRQEANWARYLKSLASFHRLLTRIAIVSPGGEVQELCLQLIKLPLPSGRQPTAPLKTEADIAAWLHATVRAINQDIDSQLIAGIDTLLRALKVDEP